MSKPNPSTKKAMKPIKAWAVVDDTGSCKPSTVDVAHSRARALHIQYVRRNAAFPLHPNAKWRIARVEIREVK